MQTPTSDTTPPGLETLIRRVHPDTQPDATLSVGYIYCLLGPDGRPRADRLRTTRYRVASPRLDVGADTPVGVIAAGSAASIDNIHALQISAPGLAAGVHVNGRAGSASLCRFPIAGGPGDVIQFEQTGGPPVALWVLVSLILVAGVGLYVKQIEYINKRCVPMFR